MQETCRFVGRNKTLYVGRVSDSVTRQDARETLGLRYRYAKQQNS